MISSLAEKLERKLSYFSKTVEDELTTKQREIFAGSKKDLYKTTENIEQQHQEKLKIKQEEFNRISNRKIAEAKVKAMRGFVEIKLEELEKLFVSISAILAEFTQSAEYENYLIESINAKKNRADFTRVLLSPYDMRMESKIKTATGLSVEPGRDDYIGGFILLDNNHTVRDDCTFKTTLDCEKSNFSYL